MAKKQIHFLTKCLYQTIVVLVQIIRFAFNLEPRIRAEAIGKFKSLTRSFRMALAADRHHTCKNFRLPLL